MTDPALSFGSVATSYDRGRPDYPREAVEWLVGTSPASVLELGAGTGKLTTSLVELGHDVFATDPDDKMLDVLSAKLPDVRATVGTAEQIPAPDGAFDVVVAAQAYHWFDTERALPEISRVLKPRGVLAMVWNGRDARIPWVRRLGKLIGKQAVAEDPIPAIDDSALFSAVDSAVFRHWQGIDRESIQDLVLSRSNVAVLSEEEREAKRAEVLAFYDDYGRGMDGMQLPYQTFCYRTAALPQSMTKAPSSQPAPPHAPLRHQPTMTDTAARLPRIVTNENDDTGTILINFR